MTVLKETRTNRGYAQETFAIEANIALRTYQAYESEGMRPSLTNGIVIAEKFGFTTIQELKDLFPLPTEIRPKEKLT